MRRLLMLLSALLVALAAPAQEGPFQDALLGRLEGAWVMSGVIAGKETTHDVKAEWVLEHGYLRIHEVSREKGPRGGPAYEAIVFVGRDVGPGYACLWLDSTGGGGLDLRALGHGQRDGNAIPFLFKVGSEVFHTTFRYQPESGTWQWLMDGEKGGAFVPFARLTLVPARSGDLQNKL